jgi:photosystem II stability/assembly factor-like uncharacterized protein
LFTREDLTMTKPIPKAGDVVLMVGTRKGGFFFTSNPERKSWQRSSHHDGWMVHDNAYDPRDGSIYSATNGEVFGGVVQRTVDFGQTWKKENEGLDFDPSSENRVRKVWKITPGSTDHPGRVYAGSERAGLFLSDDYGRKWKEVTGLNQHPHSPDWQPGGGGLCMHTILIDPENSLRQYAAISTGGLYRSDDGGDTWNSKNSGVRADFMADTYPEFGQCPHHIVIPQSQPATLYQQNHCGVYRSDDYGDHWIDISDGLPSRFGFPMGVHAHDPDSLYVVPLIGDDRRVVPDSQMTVWRSQDRGLSWKALTRGLPESAYLTVLREGMAVDDCDPCGIYIGTQTGQIFYSRDEGENWEMLADFLPSVYSLSVARWEG